MQRSVPARGVAEIKEVSPKYALGRCSTYPNCEINIPLASFAAFEKCSSSVKPAQSFQRDPVNFDCDNLISFLAIRDFVEFEGHFENSARRILVAKRATKVQRRLTNVPAIVDVVHRTWGVIKLQGMATSFGGTEGSWKAFLPGSTIDMDFKWVEIGNILRKGDELVVDIVNNKLSRGFNWLASRVAFPPSMVYGIRGYRSEEDKYIAKDCIGIVCEIVRGATSPNSSRDFEYGVDPPKFVNKMLLHCRGLEEHDAYVESVLPEPFVSTCKVGDRFTFSARRSNEGELWEVYGLKSDNYQTDRGQRDTMVVKDSRTLLTKLNFVTDQKFEKTKFVSYGPNFPDVPETRNFRATDASRRDRYANDAPTKGTNDAHIRDSCNAHAESNIEGALEIKRIYKHFAVGKTLDSRKLIIQVTKESMTGDSQNKPFPTDLRLILKKNELLLFRGNMAKGYVTDGETRVIERFDNVAIGCHKIRRRFNSVLVNFFLIQDTWGLAERSNSSVGRTVASRNRRNVENQIFVPGNTIEFNFGGAPMRKIFQFKDQIRVDVVENWPGAKSPWLATNVMFPNMCTAAFDVHDGEAADAVGVRKLCLGSIVRIADNVYTENREFGLFCKGIGGNCLDDTLTAVLPEQYRSCGLGDRFVFGATWNVDRKLSNHEEVGEWVISDVKLDRTIFLPDDIVSFFNRNPFDLFTRVPISEKESKRHNPDADSGKSSKTDPIAEVSSSAKYAETFQRMKNCEQVLPSTESHDYSGKYSAYMESKPSASKIDSLKSSKSPTPDSEVPSDPDTPEPLKAEVIFKPTVNDIDFNSEPVKKNEGKSEFSLSAMLMKNTIAPFGSLLRTLRGDPDKDKIADSTVASSGDNDYWLKNSSGGKTKEGYIIGEDVTSSCLRTDNDESSQMLSDSQLPGYSQPPLKKYSSLTNRDSSVLRSSSHSEIRGDSTTKLSTAGYSKENAGVSETSTTADNHICFGISQNVLASCSGMKDHGKHLNDAISARLKDGEFNLINSVEKLGEKDGDTSTGIPICPPMSDERDLNLKSETMDTDFAEFVGAQQQLKMADSDVGDLENCRQTGAASTFYFSDNWASNRSDHSSENDGVVENNEFVGVNVTANANWHDDSPVKFYDTNDFSDSDPIVVDDSSTLKVDESVDFVIPKSDSKSARRDRPDGFGVLGRGRGRIPKSNILPKMPGGLGNSNTKNSLQSQKLGKDALNVNVGRCDASARNTDLEGSFPNISNTERLATFMEQAGSGPRSDASVIEHRDSNSHYSLQIKGANEDVENLPVDSADDTGSQNIKVNKYASETTEPVDDLEGFCGVVEPNAEAIAQANIEQDFDIPSKNSPEELPRYVANIKIDEVARDSKLITEEIGNEEEVRRFNEKLKAELDLFLGEILFDLGGSQDDQSRAGSQGDRNLRGGSAASDLSGNQDGTKLRLEEKQGKKLGTACLEECDRLSVMSSESRHKCEEFNCDQSTQINPELAETGTQTEANVERVEPQTGKNKKSGLDILLKLVQDQAIFEVIVEKAGRMDDQEHGLLKELTNIEEVSDVLTNRQWKMICKKL